MEQLETKENRLIFVCSGFRAFVTIAEKIVNRQDCENRKFFQIHYFKTNKKSLQVTKAKLNRCTVYSRASDQKSSFI